MSISRKCPECGSWNDDNDHCINCGHLLNVDKQRVQEEEKKRKLSPPRVDAVDAFLARLGQSSNPFKKLAYYLLNSLWFVLIAILSFIYFLIAMTAG